MMKVEHRQTGEMRDVSRHTWENPESEYQKLNHVWRIISAGDPVTVIWIEDDGQETNLGLLDRDHAQCMVKANSSRCYIKESNNMESEQTYEGSTELELIDIILKEAEKDWISLMRATPDNYQKAVEKMKRIGLLKMASKYSYEITNEGYEAIEMGGYKKWNEERKRRKNPQPPSINVGGHAIIGDNNSGVNQNRDFFDSASPTMQNITPSEKPAESPIKKTPHDTWDKIKYIAGISAAVAAILGLVKMCMS